MLKRIKEGIFITIDQTEHADILKISIYLFRAANA